MKKREKLIRNYIGKLRGAIERGYHFEAAWLEYAILEDRLESILRSTGGVGGLRMMGPKMGEINSRMAGNNVLTAQVGADNMNKLDAWKDDRNDLMHAMMNGTMTIEAIDALVASVAGRGNQLVADFAAAARRIKRYKNR